MVVRPEMDMALVNFQCPHLSWKKTTGFLGHGQILLRARTILVGRVQGQDGGEPPGSAGTVDHPESAVTNRKEKGELCCAAHMGCSHQVGLPTDRTATSPTVPTSASAHGPLTTGSVTEASWEEIFPAAAVWTK